MKKSPSKRKTVKRATAVREPSVPEDEMLPEYNFRGGVRGKYAERFAKGTNVVVLDPDVAAVFPNSSAVNSALRALAEVARRQSKRGRAPAA